MKSCEAFTFPNTEKALRIRIDQLEDKRDELEERIGIAVPLEAEEIYNELSNRVIVARSELALWMRLYERERQACVALIAKQKRLSAKRKRLIAHRRRLSAEHGRLFDPVKG